MAKQKDLADDDIVGNLASNDISGSEDDFTESDDDLVPHWGRQPPSPMGGLEIKFEILRMVVNSHIIKHHLFQISLKLVNYFKTSPTGDNSALSWGAGPSGGDQGG